MNIFAKFFYALHESRRMAAERHLARYAHLAEEAQAYDSRPSQEQPAAETLRERRESALLVDWPI
jgi:hypothetical protein